MEETKILLGSSKHKLGVNEDNFVGVELSSNSKVLPYTEDSYHIDAYSQYFKEKDESDKFRFAFTITPFCTNVLFNMITEPVYKEGSADCAAVYYVDAINKIQGTEYYYGFEERDNYSPSNAANPFTTYNSRKLNTNNVIRDTGYSHPKIEKYPLVYHCGYDIFNNHTLRKKEFNVVNSGKTSVGDDFNTIKDKIRDRGGNVVKENILQVNQDGKININETDTHLYQYETISSYGDSIYDNLIENNGWFGFLNVTTIPIDNFTGADGEKHSINKCMNNNKAWEQIDMYPDRSLYSFVPKINKFRGRIEKNWDYCLTYPKFEDRVNTVVTSAGGVNGIKCKIVSPLTSDYLQNENELVLFKSFLRHNFEVGGYVTLSFIDSAQNERKTANPVKIMSLGNNGTDTEHYFSVRFSSILNEVADITTNDKVTTLVSNISEVRARKFENGGEAQYYFRIFEKIGEDCASSLNKLAFSQNIYSDQVAQIVFTDDIETLGLKDNKNRPVSEVYLTIVKRNKGRDKWYQGDVTSDEIEFSHCFGEVTSGVDMPEDDECKDYNVHRIHSISDVQAEARGITKSPEKIETGITIEEGGHCEMFDMLREMFDMSPEDVLFYGDIVEFQPSTMSETTIEPVYHRFNTAQREDTNGKYSGFTYDELIHDDYDIGENFTIGTKPFGDKSKFMNLIPEGYYYKPHYKVQIRKFEDEVKQGSNITVNFTSAEKTSASGNKWNITTSKNYYFMEGDEVQFYIVTDGKVTYEATGVCESVGGVNFSDVTLSFNKSVNLKAEGERLFRKNPIMPEDAYLLPDGTGRYLWRSVESYADMDIDNELYDTPFTNGAHYFHRNVMFYLKRQDPYGIYGIGNEPSDLSAWFQFSVNGKDKDVSYAEYVEEGGGTVC